MIGTNQIDLSSEVYRMLVMSALILEFSNMSESHSTAFCAASIDFTDPWFLLSILAKFENCLLLIRNLFNLQLFESHYGSIVRNRPCNTLVSILNGLQHSKGPWLQTQRNCASCNFGGDLISRSSTERYFATLPKPSPRKTIRRPLKTSRICCQITTLDVFHWWIWMKRLLWNTPNGSFCLACTQ